MSTVPPRLADALADRYRIERELGAGGMATVYLAYDVRHDRRVALKVLRPELAAVIGADRFLAEIRTTANLQHPHILPLFDSGTVDGTVYYAMPFVPGEALRDRLRRERQLPIAEAVRIATQVAGALDYAHRNGVIHRDIKPENVLLHDGSALVADFGIALAASRSEGSSRMTETGLSLGTPHYMSPEQAMGERGLDARADVYALGCMLYEMLAGETPFHGPNAQAIIARVISSEPAPVTTLRRMVPPHVAAAVHTAIQKLPADRFETAAGFAEALSNPAAMIHRTALAGTHVPLRANRPALLFAGIAALATAAALWAGFGKAAPAASGDLDRFALSLPAGQELVVPGGARLAYAPDGRSFVYTGPGPAGSQLWLRRRDELDARPIAGSEGATNPSFSPDGSQITFLTLLPFSLKVVPVTGGPARTIVGENITGGGQVWGADGYIYFDGGVELARVRPDGSDRSPVMALDTLSGEVGLAWPSLLPDGRGVLVRIRRNGDPLSDHQIFVVDLRTGTRKPLLRALMARYSPTGHLLWVAADGTLYAQRFDVDRLELTGQPATLWNGVAIGGFGAADVALSTAGDLVYTTGGISAGLAELVWVARDGSVTRVDSVAEDGRISAVAISPGGSTAALEIIRTSGDALTRIWVKRLGGGPTQLVTAETSNSHRPTWAAAGRDLLYTSEGGEVVMRRRADGSGTPELVLREPRGVADLALAPDGQTVVLRIGADGTNRGDLLRFRIGTDSVALPLLTTPAHEADPAISPDGRWLAYVASENGPPQVYVRPFPDVDAQRVQVSVNGGRKPRWKGAGNELFFLSDSGDSGDMMVARVRTSPTFTVESVQRLFRVSRFQSDGVHAIYDVSADGQRFLMLDLATSGAQANAGGIVAVQNFAGELRRRLPE